MKTKKICPVCGREFSTSRNAKKFCTEWCKKKANQSEMPPQHKQCICGWCGMTFYSQRRKIYCSAECRMFANGRYSLPKAEPKHQKPSLSIDEAVALARLAGMTYGEYVQKYNV